MAKREYKANNANLELYQKLNIMISKVHAPFINNIKSTGLSDKYNMQDWTNQNGQVMEPLLNRKLSMHVKITNRQSS